MASPEPRSTGNRNFSQCSLTASPRARIPGLTRGFGSWGSRLPDPGRQVRSHRPPWKSMPAGSSRRPLPLLEVRPPLRHGADLQPRRQRLPHGETLRPRRESPAARPRDGGGARLPAGRTGELPAAIGWLGRAATRNDRGGRTPAFFATGRPRSSHGSPRVLRCGAAAIEFSLFVLGVRCPCDPYRPANKRAKQAARRRSGGESTKMARRKRLTDSRVCRKR